MKILGKLIFAAATLGAMQGAGAAVLVGIYDFVGDKSGGIKPVEMADEELIPGLVGWVESPIQSSTGNGGDTGNTYGLSGGPIAVSSGLGDGFATVRVAAPGPNRTPGGSSMMSFFVQNNTGASVLLPYLFFDAAATSGQFDRYLTVEMVTGSGSSGVLGSPFGPLLPTDPQNFSDYDVPVNYNLADGETVRFVFSAAPGSALGTTLWIDNIAVGPMIPEPSTLAMGSLLAMGLCFRRRRS